MLILLKIHGSESREVLAACDKEILGKTLEDEKICFEVTESFYAGKTAERKELAKALKEHANINLVGEKVVRIAVEEGIIEEGRAKMIAGIPHVQIYRL